LAYLLCAAFNPELRGFWAEVLECGEGGRQDCIWFAFLLRIAIFTINEKQILSHLQYLICRAATGAKVVAVSRWRSGAL
jgi:hypothetical protein